MLVATTTANAFNLLDGHIHLIETQAGCEKLAPFCVRVAQRNVSDDFIPPPQPWIKTLGCKSRPGCERNIASNADYRFPQTSTEAQIERTEKQNHRCAHVYGSSCFLSGGSEAAGGDPEPEPGPGELDP